MADLRLEHIYKVYPNGVKAVNDFTMDIKDKEFIVFVGPSGCGKSTTLRMIAGLEEITAGELYIGDQIVNDMEPKDRDIAMVFQNYALYPHMTVYENMAFGLKLRHLPADEIHEKVLWAADVLGLKEYLDRKPKAMSGGQRQRVSLGRAILRNPKVMLLDEPLSNLDAKLRSQMRSEISKLHQKLGTTFIYVTHDQVEAMTLGTRVVVMKLGRVQQIDTPKNLYDFPTNKFVAGFIGTPQMNFFEAKLEKVGDKVSVKFENSNAQVNVPFVDLIKIKSSYLTGEKIVTVGLRCEDISIEEDVVKNAKDLIDVKVSHFEELGNETLIYGDINMEGDGFAETNTRVILKASGRHGLVTGDIVKAAFNMDKAHFFDIETEQSIKPRIPEDNLVHAKISDNVITVYNETYKLPSALDIKEFEGTIIVPNDAIVLNHKGLTAKVIKVEQVNDKFVNYLEANKEVFFVTTDEALELNKEIEFTLDFSKIDIKNGEESLVNPIPEFDEFHAHFNNYASVVKDTNNPEFVAKRDEKIAEVNKAFEDELAKLNADYEAELAEAQNIDYVDVKATNDAKMAKEIKEIADPIAKLEAETKDKLNAYKAEHKENLINIKKAVEEEYARRTKEENDDFHQTLTQNSDKDVIYQRKQEHRVFKENTPLEKQNELEGKISNENLDYGAKLSAAKIALKREKSQAKRKIKEIKKSYARANNLVKALQTEHKKALANLEKEHKQALLDADLIFFFKFNDAKNYVSSPDTITNKLIQGLGTKVFNKIYLFKVPHNAYFITEEGINGTVVGSLDYDVRKFVKVEVETSKEIIYIETENTYAIGDKVCLGIKLEDTQIIENGMKIRLY